MSTGVTGMRTVSTIKRTVYVEAVECDLIDVTEMGQLEATYVPSVVRVKVRSRADSWWIEWPSLDVPRLGSPLTIELG